MSMRTIVEFNHDYAHEITENSAEFATFLRYALSRGDAEQWERLERFGVRRAVMAHHSDERSVLVNKREYPLP